MTADWNQKSESWYNPPDPPVVMFLGSYRSGEATDNVLLQSLPVLRDRSSEAVRWQVVTLDPLPAQEAKELARSLLRQERPGADMLAEAIAKESAGNPFLLQELARHVRRSSPLEKLDQRQLTSLTLEAAIWSRIELLAPSEQELLKAVAVAGQAVDVEICFALVQEQASQSKMISHFKGEHLLRNIGGELSGSVSSIGTSAHSVTSRL